MGVGVAGTSGSQTSLAAEKVSPPVPQTVGCGLMIAMGLFAVVLFVGLGSAFGADSVASKLFVNGGVISSIVAIMYWAHLRNKRFAVEHALRMEEWHKLWYCMRCGAVGNENDFLQPE